MSIEEIKDHPWYNLDLPLKEDVWFELKQRRELIDTVQTGEKPGAADKTIFSDPKWEHWGDDETDEDEKMPVLEWTCKEYVPSLWMT